MCIQQDKTFSNLIAHYECDVNEHYSCFASGTYLCIFHGSFKCVTIGAAPLEGLCLAPLGGGMQLLNHMQDSTICILNHMQELKSMCIQQDKTFSNLIAHYLCDINEHYSCFASGMYLCIFHGNFKCVTIGAAPLEGLCLAPLGGGMQLLIWVTHSLLHFCSNFKCVTIWVVCLKWAAMLSSVEYFCLKYSKTYCNVPKVTCHSMWNFIFS